MKVNKSRYLTYCNGVNNAINRALAELEEKPDKKIYMLGEIVHNTHVVRKLTEKGIKTVNSIEDVPDGSVMVIRAHGATQDTYERAKNKDLEIINATCSIVLNNQKLVRELEEQGYTVTLIGDKHHDEVISIISFAQNPIVVSNKEDIFNNRNRLKKIAVLLQTTEIIHNVKNMIAELALYAHEMRFFNTICGPSRIKQNEAIKLAKENDAIYIVGSKTSKNTKNLYWLAKNYNDRAYFIEDKSMIEASHVKDAKSVAVIAGTSTMKEIINEVIMCLESM